MDLGQGSSFFFFCLKPQVVPRLIPLSGEKLAETVHTHQTTENLVHSISMLSALAPSIAVNTCSIAVVGPGAFLQIRRRGHEAKKKKKPKITNLNFQAPSHKVITSPS